MTENGTAAVLEPAATESAVKNAEAAIGALVKQINATGMTPDRVVTTIAEHTKAVLSHTTAESRSRLHRLFESLGQMDEFLQKNEQRLKDEIDRHVEFSHSAGRAAMTIEDTIGEWQKAMNFKAQP